MNNQIKMFIGNDEVVSNHEFTIKEEMLSASSTILNNCYPKSWELDKDYISKFYYPKDYSKFILGEGEFLHGDKEFQPMRVETGNLISPTFRQGTRTGLVVSNILFSDTNYYLEKGKTYTISTDLDLSVYEYTLWFSSVEFPSHEYTHSIFSRDNSKTFTSPNDEYIGIQVNRRNQGNISPSDISSNSFTLELESMSYETNVERKWDTIDIYGKTNQKNLPLVNLYDFRDMLVMVDGVKVDDMGWITVSYDNTSGTATKYFSYWTNNLNLQTSHDYNIVLEVKNLSGTGGIFSESIYSTNQGQFTSGAWHSFVDISANSVYCDIRTTKSDFTNIVDGLRTYVQFTAGQSGSITFRLSVLEDTSITPETFVYSAYGGKPSPNQFSNICNVGYNNLFDKYSIVMGDYTNAYNTIRASSRNIIPVEPGKYTLTTNLDLSTYGVSVDLLPNIPPSSSYNTMATTGYITTNVRTFYIVTEGFLVLTFKKGNNQTFTIDEIMQFDYSIVRGVENKGLLDYGKYNINLTNIGKNLFDKSTIVQETRAGVSSTNRLSTRQILYLDKGKYTFSTNLTNVYKYGLGVLPEPLPNSYDYSFDTGWIDNSTYTFELTESGYFQINYRKSDNSDLTVDEIKQFNFQLERGDTATEYEGFKSNNQVLQLNFPLRSVGDIADYLYLDNNTLCVDRKIGTVVLNGTENWYTSGAVVDAYTVAFRCPGIPQLAGIPNFQAGYCNYFRIIDKDTEWSPAPMGSACFASDQFYIKIPKTVANSVADLKTWLSTHNLEIQYILPNPYLEIVGQVSLPKSYEGVNNIFMDIGAIKPSNFDIYYYWKNFNVLFSGIVKNSGEISLNPRYPHYCSLQILDYKAFLSESDTLDFVISDKTIREAIEMVISAVSSYGFIVGYIDISSEDEIIGAYSTLNKTAYDVLQYLADISGSRWRARYVDSSSMAIDFYEPDALPQGQDIEYTKEYWEENNIVDLTFNYGTRDYRNKQIILSDEVYAGIEYTEVLLSNGYNTTFIVGENVGYVMSITVNGVAKDVISQQEKELGADADFVYTPGKNIIESSSSYTAGTQIAITYVPLVKGRQIIFNDEEIARISTQTNTIGVISRYESRNDIVSSKELEQIGESYIEFKGKAEVILTLTTKDKDIYNIGEVVFFNSPIEELAQKYMVKSKQTQYIIEHENGNRHLFYIYEMTSSFNSEKAINYFDNQRNKSQGNIQEGESITRNIDINNSATVIWANASIEEVSVSVDGDNVLNSVLNSPFID